jgi:hypothetical protein
VVIANAVTGAASVVIVVIAVSGRRMPLRPKAANNRWSASSKKATATPAGRWKCLHLPAGVVTVASYGPVRDEGHESDQRDPHGGN